MFPKIARIVPDMSYPITINFLLRRRLKRRAPVPKGSMRNRLATDQNATLLDEDLVRQLGDTGDQGDRGQDRCGGHCDGSIGWFEIACIGFEYCNHQVCVMLY